MKTHINIIIIFIFTICSSGVFSQDSKEKQIKEIRQEFQKINAELNTYSKKEVFYDAGKNYWNNTNYASYFNTSNKLVLLKFTHGEEGYWTEYEYYFKNGEIFFVYMRSGEPNESEKEERFYFKDKKIIEALIKSKSEGEKKSMKEIPNQPHEEFNKDLKKSTDSLLNEIQNELKLFNQALKKQK